MKKYLMILAALLMGCSSVKHKTKTEETETQIIENQDTTTSSQTENTTASLQSHGMVIENHSYIALVPVDQNRPIEIIDQHGNKKTVHNATIMMGKSQKQETTQLQQTLQTQKTDTLIVEKKQSIFNNNLIKNSHKDKQDTFINNWMWLILIVIAYVGYTKLKKDDQNKNT